MRKFILCVALSVLAFSLSAISFDITFLSGKVEVKAGTAWKRVSIGDSLAEDATVRLPKGAILELNSQKGKFIISVQGTYLLSSFKAAEKDPRIVDLFKKMSTPGTTTSAVAGVRGAQSGTSGSDLVFMTGDDNADSDNKRGMDLFTSESFKEALPLFARSLQAFTERDDPPEDLIAQTAYLAGYCAFRNGSDAMSLAYLRQGNPAKAGGLRSQYALLLAAIESTIGSKPDAKAILDKGLREGWFGEEEQTARNILGTAK